MRFEFETDLEDLDERSEFANAVCKLIVDKNNGNLINSLNEVGDIYDMFFISVRNIYELVDSEIPLFALYELHNFGADNLGLTPEEFKQAKQSSMLACSEYYLETK